MSGLGAFGSSGSNVISSVEAPASRRVPTVACQSPSSRGRWSIGDASMRAPARRLAP